MTFNSSRRFYPTTALAIYLGLCLMAGEVTHAASDPDLTSVERELPTFNLQALDGQTWTAESLAGKAWIVNFWATWCPPCIEELPSMNAAWDVLESQGVGMLAINAGEGEAAVENFLAKRAIDFPHVLGEANTLPNWSVRALPTTLLINSEGQVIYEALGPREWDDAGLLKAITDLL